MIRQFVLVLFCAGLTVTPGEARALEGPEGGDSAQEKHEETRAVDPGLYEVGDYLRALGGGSYDADDAETWGDAAPDLGSLSAEDEDPDYSERMRDDYYDAASPRRLSNIYSHMARG